MKIEMYTGNNCKYCEMAKMLLASKGMAFETVNVHENPNGLEVLQKNGLRTVPQVWIDDKYIGGYTELHTYLRELNTVTGA